MSIIGSRDDRGSGRKWGLPGGASAVALAAVLVIPRPGLAVDRPALADPETDEVTFARDVAPILQENCQSCHNPQGMAPMSLTTYEEARPWAPLIKDRVVARKMPPWHIDRTVGIQEFKNDISLSDEEIRTIAQWVDSGAPLGDRADLPPPIVLPDAREWQLEERFGRPPDLILRSEPYTVMPTGLDQWWTPQVKVEGLDEPRWVMANETKPAYPLGLRVVHHANAAIVRDGGSSGFSNYGVGKPFDEYPDNTGRLLKPEDELSWNIHYYPIGEEVKDDVVEVGIWFYPEGEEPRLETVGDQTFFSYRQTAGPDRQEMILPPHSRTVTQGVRVLDQPARIHSCRGHMHLLGEAQELAAIYPDGRSEILCRVLWDHNWHITYLIEEHAQPLLPAGTVVTTTAWYDNTASNPNNPDPDQWVVHGRRTVDEMSHMWIGITYLDDDDFAWLVAERERQLRERELADSDR